MASPNLSDYLTVSQAAKRAGVDPDTIRRWLQDGLPYVSLGGRTKAIFRDDLDGYARQAEENRIRQWTANLRSAKSTHTSKTTILNDRPLLPEEKIAANRAKLARIMAQKKAPIVLGMGEKL